MGKMADAPMSKSLGWRLIKKANSLFDDKSMINRALDFLESMEPYSVSAYSRFIHRITNHDRTWALFKRGGRGHTKAALLGLLVHQGYTLYPIFDPACEEEAAPSFLRTLVDKYPLHAIHGLGRDVAFFERCLHDVGYDPSERVLYDLMVMNGYPAETSFARGPAGLILRQAGRGDMDALFQLQAAYEKEEVLQKAAKFEPAVCRLNLERIATNEQLLLAELGGRVVAKLNTIGTSPSWYQIGGVYVDPRFRGHGIATRMTAVFVRGLLDTGKQVSLFVKKSNPAARAAYSRVGFSVLADYRISYY
jgi:GNAT superfamily N-acetyltransferase